MYYLIIGLVFFNCSPEEEIIEEQNTSQDIESFEKFDSELIEGDPKSNVREIYFSNKDNVKGWSWNGTTASYIVEIYDKSYLYVRNFNGFSFGPVLFSMQFSSSNNIRGWSWDGTTASYVAVQGGISRVYVRPFNGTSLGPVSSVTQISSGDKIRSWSLNGTVASYHAILNGAPSYITRQFNPAYGFGSATITSSGIYEPYRSWSLPTSSTNYTSSHHALKNGKTYVYITF